MFIKNRKKMLFTSVVAVVLSVASTAALASAMSYDESEDDADFKTTACSLIGCPNGNRVCGTAAGTVKAGVPPFVGEVEVSYTCYEKALY